MGKLIMFPRTTVIDGETGEVKSLSQVRLENLREHKFPPAKGPKDGDDVEDKEE
jgi:hypothetical protein